MSAPIAAAKASETVAVPIQPALRPGSERYPSAIPSVPSSGRASAIQAKVVALTRASPTAARPIRGSPLQLPQLVDVDRQAAAMDRHDHAQPDADLARGHGHHDERHDLSVAVSPQP